uniref:BZIP domain-containing protein n=1 Tax=Haemonchus placei TaxID=6290 RepID=A0A0N4WP37_HAEPC
LLQSRFNSSKENLRTASSFHLTGEGKEALNSTVTWRAGKRRKKQKFIKSRRRKRAQKEKKKITRGRLTS